MVAQTQKKNNMSPETLAYIKQEIRKFHRLVIKPVCEYWDHPCYVMISVLIQNMGSDFINTVNYSHEEAENDLMKILKILSGLNEYENVHFVQYVYEQVDLIVSGNVMTEEYNNDLATTADQQEEMKYTQEFTGDNINGDLLMEEEDLHYENCFNNQ